MYPDDKQLEPFRVDRVEDPHVFSFEVVKTLPVPLGDPEVSLPEMQVYRDNGKEIRYVGMVDGGWENANVRLEPRSGGAHVQVKLPTGRTFISVKTVLDALSAEHLAAEKNGFVLHCSYVACNGSAILFTAPSGTGKSTQAELWREYRSAEIVNGDRAVVRIRDGVLLAEGIPFSGSSSYYENRTLKIAAIVYLSQAPQTTIRRMVGAEAFFRVWEGISVNAWIKKDVEQVSNVAQQVAVKIPVYHLACTPDESAVIALEEALRKQEAV